MKKTLALVAWVFVLSACGGGGGSGFGIVAFLSSMKLQPVVAGGLSQGQGFSVNVNLANVPNVFQAAWRVNYDAAKLQFTGVSVGPLLQKDNESPNCITLLNGGKAIGGQAAVFISRQGSACGNTDKVTGTLATLNFTALQAVPSSSLNTIVTFPADVTRFALRDATKKSYTLTRVDAAQVGVTLQ